MIETTRAKSRLDAFVTVALVTAIVTMSGVLEARAQDAAGVPAASSSSAASEEYRIGPMDKLDINVFEVKDLTLSKVEVDASGRILLPLIGLVDVKGRTATQVSGEIAKRLDANYMQDAQVSVVVEESENQKVTVGGAVTEAGVFHMRGRTTLLQAIALAKGPSKTADLKHVTVFRTESDGARQRLAYNVAAIELGRQADPEIYGNDVVLVRNSEGKDFFQNFVIPAAPLLYILPYLHL